MILLCLMLPWVAMWKMGHKWEAVFLVFVDIFALFIGFVGALLFFVGPPIALGVHLSVIGLTVMHFKEYQIEQRVSRILSAITKVSDTVALVGGIMPPDDRVEPPPAARTYSDATNAKADTILGEGKPKDDGPSTLHNAMHGAQDALKASIESASGIVSGMTAGANGERLVYMAAGAIVLFFIGGGIWLAKNDKSMTAALQKPPPVVNGERQASRDSSAPSRVMVDFGGSFSVSSGVSPVIDKQKLWAKRYRLEMGDVLNVWENGYLVGGCVRSYTATAGDSVISLSTCKDTKAEYTTVVVKRAELADEKPASGLPPVAFDVAPMNGASLNLIQGKSFSVKLSLLKSRIMRFKSTDGKFNVYAPNGLKLDSCAWSSYYDRWEYLQLFLEPCGPRVTVGVFEAEGWGR